MKKLYSLIIAALAMSLSLMAEEGDTGFKWSAGGEVVSQYIWRGINSGGLSFQPNVEIGYQGEKAGFTVGAWASLGGSNASSEWTQKYFGFGGKYGAEFSPELDVYLGFNVRGFSMMLTHYHYFNRPWYDMRNEEGWDGNQLEVTLQYRISDEIPLKIQWNTILAGTDGYYKKDGKAIFSEDLDEADLNEDGTPKGAELKQAFSSYVEVSYDVYLTDWLTLTPTIGFSPWRSMYSDYQRKFAFNNCNVRLEASWEFNYASMSVFAQPYLNFDDIKHFEYGKNFSWVIGLGFWFGN